MKIKTIFKNNFTLIAILIIAAFLRIWQLASVPPHLSPDEAALGYNAYSIMLTGKDEHGEFLPTIFKSFGDYKPGLYVYTAIPSIAIFGLTEFAVRLPSAIAGVMAVWLVYLIIKQLSFNKLLKIENSKLETASALLMALSPWHIQFSRGAWEANLALTLVLAGVLTFLFSLEKPKYLLLSSLFFSLTLITYQGAKLSTALVVIILVALYWRKLIKINRDILLAAFGIGIIVSLPILLSFANGQTGRLGVFSIFSYPRDEEYILNFINETGVVKNSFAYDLFYNEPLNFLRGVMGRYFNHFSGRFLFFEGDWQTPMFSAPYHGMLTLADLPLLITGLYVAFKNIHKTQFIFIIVWLLLAPLPAVLTRDQVQAVRSLHMVVPLSIILGMGLWWLWNSFKTKKVIRVLIIITYFISYLYYLDAYFVHFPKSRSNLWGYGYKQIVTAIEPLMSKYERIKVEQSFAQPYIYFLFYGKYDPKTYQYENNFIEGKGGDVGFVKRLGKIRFGSIHQVVEFEVPGVVAAKITSVPPEKIADETKYEVIKRIYFPGADQREGYIVFVTNPNE